MQGDARHAFVQGDIGDSALVSSLLAQHQPRAVLTFAAENPTDRFIHNPEEFIQTEIAGTFSLLQLVRAYWREPDSKAKSAFRFLNVSTDEVYGSLHAADSAL